MRKHMPILLTGALALALGAGPVRAHPGKGPGGHGPGEHGAALCSAQRCAVETAIDQACPCEGAASHGQYVRCVAHAVKDLAASGIVARGCRGKVVSCAARSACGHPGRVSCFLPTGECRVQRSAADCTAAGGVASITSTCCAVGCASPGGAFVD
jgi:hypothetical protein